MDTQKLTKLIQKLSGLNWCFFSGFAIEVYTNGRRKANDIDILVAPGDIEIFAQRLNCQLRHRRFKKFNFFVNDYGFDTEFLNLKIEASSGFPKRRIRTGSIQKVFQNKVRKRYLGANFYIEPLEEIIVHKADMLRPKDIRDLKMLKTQKIKWSLLKEFAKDWGKYSKIINNLKNLGYQIPETISH